MWLYDTGFDEGGRMLMITYPLFATVAYALGIKSTGSGETEANRTYRPTHPYTILKEAIEGSGSAILVEAGPQPQPFGSAWAIYKFPAATVRLIWEGRDCWAFLQQKQDGTWINLAPYLSRSDFATTLFGETAGMKQLRKQIELLSLAN